MTTEVDVDAMIAEQKHRDEETRAAAREIVDAQDPKTLEEARAFAAAWIGTAMQEARNAAYYQGQTEKYRKVLESIREMMGPENRQRYVMQGPRAFIGLYNIIGAALK